MKRVFLILASAAVVGSAALLAPPVTFAQEESTGRSSTETAQSATVRIDTVARQRMRRAPSPGVQSVRRRIRQIRGGRQRVVYPVVIVPPATPAREQPSQRFRGGALPGIQPSQAPYYLPGGGTRLRTRRPFYYDPATGEVVVRRGEEADPEDDLIPIFPDSAQAPPPGIENAPVFRRIERAILETGLFQASNVNFEFDESTLLPASENTLNAVGEVLARYPALRIAVEGHTDAVGSEAYNQQLSARRAEAVVQYLSARGIDAARLESVGFGEARPIASNGTSTGRTLNRRVNFRVLNPAAAERYLEAGEASTEAPDAAVQDSLLREAIRTGVREAMRELSGSDGN